MSCAYILREDKINIGGSSVNYEQYVRPTLEVMMKWGKLLGPLWSPYEATRRFRIQASDPLKIELGNEGFLSNPSDMALESFIKERLGLMYHEQGALRMVH